MRLVNAIQLTPNDDPKKSVPILATQIAKLYNAFHGRVSFGSGTTGERGENIAGEFATFTTASANVEKTVSLTTDGAFNNDNGAIPKGYIVLHQDKAGSLYQGPTTGTAWTKAAVYVKSDVATVTFSVFFIK